MIHNNNSPLPFHIKKKKKIHLYQNSLLQFSTLDSQENKEKSQCFSYTRFPKNKEKKVRISPHVCAQYKISGPQAQPKFGPFEDVPSTTSTKPFCKLFLDCIRRKTK